MIIDPKKYKNLDDWLIDNDDMTKEEIDKTLKGRKMIYEFQGDITDNFIFDHINRENWFAAGTNKNNEENEYPPESCYFELEKIS